MPNKTITQLSPAASVADVDEFEVQVSGDTVTKKATRKQVTQIEETARAAQDDVIEYSLGLNADGTYPTSRFADSWYLRTADHQSIVDRSGLVEDLPSDYAAALQILDYRTHDISQVLVAEVSLTSAEIKDLHANAKVLILGEAGYVTEIISIAGFLDYTAPIYVNNAADSLKFGYTGGLSMFTITNTFFVSSADIIFRATKTADEAMLVAANFAVYIDSAITTGNSTMKFNIVYRKVAV